MITVTDSSVSLTFGQHFGSKNGKNVLALNRAAGVAVTLPVAIGSGKSINIVNVAAVTSNSHTVKVPDASGTIRGTALLAQDGGDTSVMFEAGATADTITLDGTTTGGLVGDWIELIDMASNVWACRAHLAATGSEATPFSATVS